MQIHFFVVLSVVVFECMLIFVFLCIFCKIKLLVLVFLLLSGMDGLLNVCLVKHLKHAVLSCF